jgi:hypothetical protein
MIVWPVNSSSDHHEEQCRADLRWPAPTDAEGGQEQEDDQEGELETKAA